MSGSLIWFDGFDCYSTNSDLASVYTNVGPIVRVNTTTGRFGGGCVSGIDVFGGSMQYAFGSTLTELYFGFAWNPTPNGTGGSGGTPELFELRSASGREVYLTISPLTSQMQLFTDGGTLLATISSPLIQPTNAYTYMEFHFIPNTGTGGSFQAWISGSLVYSSTAIQTSTHVANYTILQLGVSTAADYENSLMSLDDLYVWRGSSSGAPYGPPYGDLKVETLVPTSDASPNNGTPSAGSSHYAVVDTPVGYNTSDYNTLVNTSGQEELYGISSLTGTVTNLVFAVRASLAAEMTDAGPAGIGPVVISDGTEHDDTVPNLSTNPAIRFGSILLNDPHTSSAWTYSGVNAVQLGAKVA